MQPAACGCDEDQTIARQSVISVAHVMRTYGVHGGERQLAQLFSNFQNPRFRHLFYFVYQDENCARYFSTIANLKLVALLKLRARAFPLLIVEFGLLFFVLPLLQLNLMRELKKSEVSICVAHGFQAAMVCWLAAVWLRGMKFVYVHRGTKSSLGKLPIFKLLYMPFDVVVGVSQASSDSMRGIVCEKKLLVLENGIDWQKIDVERQKCPVRSNETFTVSCVGRLLPAKGQRLLLQAFAQFNKNFSTGEFLVAGDGPDEAHLKQLAQQLGIMSRVRFLGHTNTACVLTRSDVFAHASESEGLSNAVLEAMVAGLPSVLVDAPGVSECHLNNITGFVVSRSVEALADKFHMLASDETLRRRMGDEARKRVCRHYSMEENCRRYESLYQQLVRQS